MAALTAGGTVTFDSPSGEVRTVVLDGLGSRMLRRRDYDLRLTGGHVVVLTQRSVDVYDGSSGTALASWPVALVDRRTGLLDAEGDWASSSSATAST